MSEEIMKDASRQERFAAFGRWCFREFWNGGEPGDLDGDSLQDRAMKCGLLRPADDGYRPAFRVRRGDRDDA